MSLTSAERQDFVSLLHALCEGTETDEQSLRANRLVIEDEEARRLYFDHVSLAVTLRWTLRTDDDPRDKSEPVIDPVTSAVAATRPLTAFSSPKTAWSLRPRSSAAAVTVGLSAYFILIFLLLAFQHDWRAIRPQPAGEDIPGEPVASVSRTSDCRWADQSMVLREGSNLPLGPVSLVSGVIELSFRQGAKVTLEGPVDFDVRSTNGGFLRVGKLRAQVPRSAIGFTVDTPSVTVVDLGTEFGIVVSKDGTSDVAVTIGQVNVRPFAKEGPWAPKSHRLVAGQGVRVSGQEGNVTPLAEDERRSVELGVASRTAGPVSREEHRILAWYRMGEDDPVLNVGAEEAPNPRTTLANVAAQVQKPLTIVGSVRPTNEAAPGVSHRALQFDPDLRPSLARMDGIPAIADNFVLEAWACAAATDKRATIACLGTSGKNAFGLFVVDGEWLATIGGAMFHSGIKCEVGKWTHLALLRENGRNCFFVDAVQVGSSAANPTKTPDDSFLVGGFAWTTSGEITETFPGVIDEVRLVQLRHLFQPSILLAKPASVRDSVLKTEAP